MSPRKRTAESRISICLRLPDHIAVRLNTRADERGVDRNSLIVEAITEKLDREENAGIRVG